jgi:hypothetical protein
VVPPALAIDHFQTDHSAWKWPSSLVDRMFRPHGTFPSRFVSLADANETLAAQCDPARRATASWFGIGNRVTIYSSGLSLRRPDSMRNLLFAAPLLIALSAGALAQPAGNTVLAPLPSPNLPQGDQPSDYLRAAEGALAAGRNGEAESALEMAQTRMLDRSVPLGQTNNPSDNPTIRQISQALQALAAHDRAGCMQLIQTAIASAQAQGL